MVCRWLSQIDNLEEQIKEKDMQVSSTKAKLASLQADHSSSGTALSSLEELLADKDQQIEKFVTYRVILLRLNYSSPSPFCFYFRFCLLLRENENIFFVKIAADRS